MVMAHVITDADDPIGELDEVILDLIEELQSEGELTEDQAYIALSGWLADVNLGEIIRDYQTKKGASNA
jgi:hypothetical protein